MTIKSKLVPFIAAGALASSFAAHAQTAGDSNPGTATAPTPDSGSSVMGQPPGTQSSYPSGDTTSPTGAAAPSAPSPSDQSSSSSPSTPGTSGDGAATSAPAQGSGSMGSPGTSTSPDSGGVSK
jgi:hypothetical protein